MRRRRPRDYETRRYIDHMGTDNESYRAQKESIRQILLTNGWRRDGMSKKWETYKKKVDGQTFRVKFEVYGYRFDRFIPQHLRTMGGEEGRWSSISAIRYINIHTTRDIEQSLLIEPDSQMDMTDDDVENIVYLERLGVAV